MVQGLRTFRCLIAAAVLGMIPGCTSMTETPSSQGYCQIAGRTHPIHLSRADNPKTKRAVAISNMTYDMLCTKGKTNAS